MEFAVNGCPGCKPPYAIFQTPLHLQHFNRIDPAEPVGCASHPCSADFVWILNRRNPMFEHRQEEMEKLMKENEEFLRIYNRHQELDKRVTAAEIGTAPMEDLALNRLKKEKLLAKDKLARLLDMAGA
jgi:uncharacterized protein YdcH (DUF465 family)